MFLNGIQFIMGGRVSDRYLYRLLDLWPKFLRYGIIDILKTIKRIKRKNKCIKVVIYTNNMGPRSWTLLIKQYLEMKIKSPIFDKVITAYRPHNKRNCRTTHNKTFNDLIKCTGYSRDTQFLFLDDQYHPFMRHKNVKYIHLHPYNYSIPFKSMIKSYLRSKYGRLVNKSDMPQFRDYMYQYLTAGKTHDAYVAKRSRIDRLDVRQLRVIQKELKLFLNIRTTRKKRRKKRTTKRVSKRAS